MSEVILEVTKIVTMVIMFLLIAIVGSIPLRVKAFKSNKVVLSFSAAFSGGLFLSVGVLHLLPEANENITNYFAQQDNGEDVEHFPYCFFIMVASFSLILFIEKIATDHHHADEDEHDHEHNAKESHAARKSHKARQSHQKDINVTAEEDENKKYLVDDFNQ